MDYEYKTSFWYDLAFAEMFGEDLIEQMAKQLFDEWKDNVEFLTELIMILNHKCWYFYEHKNDKYSHCYETLFYQYDQEAIDYLSAHHPESLKYYFKTLD